MVTPGEIINKIAENEGLSFEIVAKILGHESVKTTESFYAKIERKSVVEAMKKAELK